MKYLPLIDSDIVTNALNFSTPDCHVIGGCDLYTTKAAGGDKKLYRNIDSVLESQYESLVRLSASLSPPYRSAASDDGKGAGHHGRKQRSRTVEPPEIDLSRASPFGPLSQIGARRTFAYLIATLNASHPDYDFSHLLRPSDFRKERSLRAIMHSIDSTLHHLRPRRHGAAASAPAHHHPHHPAAPAAPVANGVGAEAWGPRMWTLIDREMELRECEKYTYAPEEDPFDGEEGSIWSLHHFFFNKARKRVCYIYLRGLSVISHSPVSAPVVQRSRRRKTVSLAVGDGAGKRASYWLGSRVETDGIDTAHYGDDDDDDDEADLVIAAPGDDEVDVPQMDLDDIRTRLGEGYYRYEGVLEEDEGDEEGGGGYDDWDNEAWRPTGHQVRGVSEEIGHEMEMDM